MVVPRSHIRRFTGAFVPFFLLSAVFALLVEYAPTIVAREAECALYEPMSFKTVILLFIFVVLASGLVLLLLGSVDHTMPAWKRKLALWLVKRPSLFLTDILGPMFAVCLGLSLIAFVTGSRTQALGLFWVSFYIPAIAFVNLSVSMLTRKQGLIRAANLLKEKQIANYPRLVGIYLCLSAVILGVIMLPIQSSSTAC